MRATIVDVAREAGVSSTTVSHVLNGTRHVAEPTRQRVLAAIERLHYEVNSLAQSLKSDRSQTIGLLITDISTQLRLTGAKSWRGIAPYVGVGLGMAFDLGSPGDTTKSGYTFGTKFTLGGSTGVRWFPTRRVMVNADFRAQLWRLRYPASFSFPAPDGSRVVPLTDPSTDWTLHPWISLGVGWTF